MNNLYPEFFRYCRDKGSAFGHGARKRDPVKAWQETKKFLDTYTSYEITLPIEIQLRVRDGEFDRRLYENIISLLGDPQKSDEQWLSWRVSQSFDEKIDAFILNNCRYSSGYEYDMSIRLYFNFRWKNLGVDMIDKNIAVFEHFFRKGHHGKFSVFVDNRLFIQPEFVVPLDNWESFHSFVNKIIEDLPFKFSNKSFISFYTKTLKSGETRYKALGYYGK